MISLVTISFLDQLYWSTLSSEGIISLFPVARDRDFPNIYSEIILEEDSDNYEQIASLIEKKNSLGLNNELGTMEYGTLKFINYSLGGNFLLQKRIFLNGDGEGYEDNHAIYLTAVIAKDSKEEITFKFVNEDTISTLTTLFTSLLSNDLRESDPQNKYNVTDDISAEYRQESNSLHFNFTYNDVPLNFNVNAFEARLFLAKFNDLSFIA
jgi:hypothetical protein